MNAIVWLTQSFGFSYRQLSKILFASPTLLHLHQAGKRSLPLRSKKMLEHPLFAPYPIEEEMTQIAAPLWEDTERQKQKKEMEIRLLAINLAIEKETAEMQSITEKHKKITALFYHTRHLPFSLQGNESLAEQWWIVMKATARETLENLSISYIRKKHLKLALLQTEKQLLQQWILEDELEDMRNKNRQ